MIRVMVTVNRKCPCDVCYLVQHYKLIQIDRRKTFAESIFNIWFKNHDHCVGHCSDRNEPALSHAHACMHGLGTDDLGIQVISSKAQ